MGNLADRIEAYLKNVLEHTEQGFIILQRSVLAEEFSCAPSQINYVLDTRFTVERGYLVESRRGGGGYVRIVRLVLNPDGQFQQIMRQLVGDKLTQDRAFGLIDRLWDEQLLTRRETAIMKSVFAQECLAGYVSDPDTLRARMMKWILTTLCREDLG